MAGRVSRWFKLKHGSLLVSVSAACAPSLQGSLCEQYAASPTYQEVMGYLGVEPAAVGAEPAAVRAEPAAPGREVL